MEVTHLMAIKVANLQDLVKGQQVVVPRAGSAVVMSCKINQETAVGTPFQLDLFAQVRLTFSQWDIHIMIVSITATKYWLSF